MTTIIKALLSLAATIVLFTFVVIVARFTVADAPQMYVLFIRTLVASIAFLPFFIKSKVWNKTKFKELYWYHPFRQSTWCFSCGG